MSQNITMVTEKKRSEPIKIVTKVDIKCEASKTTSFKWKISRISSDPVTYKPLEKAVAVNVPVNDQPHLFVRETLLEFGYYKVDFTVFMEGVVGISGSAVGYIHVVPTNNSLQAAVDGGPRKRYKFGKNVS